MRKIVYISFRYNICIKPSQKAFYKIHPQYIYMYTYIYIHIYLPNLSHVLKY